MAPTKKVQVKWANPLNLVKSVTAVTNGVATPKILICTNCKGDAETGDVCISCDKTYCRKCIMAWLEKYNAIWMVCDGNICERCFLEQ